MSRQGAPSTQRTLTLTEELEKLEQSITLTLQEIDHNFNRAHRIVTSSILPVVERYAEHSKDVWEGSKFWKQFFEASANVSLNGYEEGANEEGETEEETLGTETSATETATPSSYSSAPRQDYPEPITPASTRFNDAATPADFSSPPQTTPRPAPTVAAYASPYETLRREVQGRATPSTPSASTLPSTPRAQTLDGSEDDDGDGAASAKGNHDAAADGGAFPPPSTARKSRRTPAADPVMHRVLDKTYRIQATPHRTQPRIQNPRSAHPKTPATATKGGGAAYARGRLDLDSSPLDEAPQMHIDMYDSPARRVPGVSVLDTPGRPSSARRTRRQSPSTRDAEAEKVDASRTADRRGAFDDIDSDDDYDLLPEGMSPPKTMHFHIPQSKLLKTPAKEASRQIMEDLLMSAGDDLTDELPDDSPGPVGKGKLEEDSF